MECDEVSRCHLYIPINGSEWTYTIYMDAYERIYPHIEVKWSSITTYDLQVVHNTSRSGVALIRSEVQHGV